MNTLAVTTEIRLVERFEEIYRERMQNLDFVNDLLAVEAIGFRDFDEIRLGVLITPWFINLVILPATGSDKTLQQGDQVDVKFPSGPINFTAAVDETIGYYLSAVLFSSVLEIPNQETARELAEEVMREIFNSARNDRNISRRELFTQSGAA